MYTYIYRTLTHTFTSVRGVTHTQACTHAHTHTHTYTHRENKEFKSHPNHPCCKKCSRQDLKKGQDEKEVKSKWTAKASVVFNADGNKF